jgi:hypothetical protein
MSLTLHEPILPNMEGFVSKTTNSLPKVMLSKRIILIAPQNELKSASSWQEQSLSSLEFKMMHLGGPISSDNMDLLDAWGCTLNDHTRCTRKC